jgi:hypothetical protein
MTSMRSSNCRHIGGNLRLLWLFAAVFMSTMVFLAGCGDSSSSDSVASLKQVGGGKEGVPLNLAGTISILAGQALPGAQDGIGSAARFNNPTGITTDGTSLYVADTANNVIRKIAIATGAVTTLAGSTAASGSADGTGSAARFKAPWGTTTDGANLYVADSNNNVIRKIVIATGAVTTMAGSAGTMGSADGAGSTALFNTPSGITTEGTNLYVSDTGSRTIRKIVIATGVVTTLAGSPEMVGSTDGTGAAARFGTPFGITTDGTNLYVVDTNNNTIRRVVIATGEVTTLAGTAGTSGTVDGTAALFQKPFGIATDGTSLYVTDAERIRKVVIATRTVTTLAGGAGWSLAEFMGITTDGINLYAASGQGNIVVRVQ